MILGGIKKRLYLCGSFLSIHLLIIIIMKKKLSILFLALSAAMTIYADPILVSVDPIVNPSDGNGDHPRSPILVPVLYIDGYTLTTADNTLGSTIQLLDENDNVVFSTNVAIEGEIYLPTTLSGTYTILVIRDDATFEGELEL